MVRVTVLPSTKQEIMRTLPTTFLTGPYIIDDIYTYIIDDICTHILLMIHAHMPVRNKCMQPRPILPKLQKHLLPVAMVDHPHQIFDPFHHARVLVFLMQLCQGIDPDSHLQILEGNTTRREQSLPKRLLNVLAKIACSAEKNLT